MCGICGIHYSDSTPVDTTVLTRMNDAMIARGPDDSGFYIDKNVGIAMRRLSIIDLSGGHQPIANEDATIHAVCNGEIYNFIELRTALESKGHRFKTKSDAETLVHLYEEYGTDAVNHLNGMFAFALWDARKKRLWIARDRLGIKPLVYRHDGSRFAFASTIDALAAMTASRRILDEEAFLLYMMLGYVPTPRTIERGVYKLPPGHWLLVEDGKVRLEKYWDVSKVRSQNLSHDEFVPRVRSLLENSITLHARSDVPVGCFLSGGVDSSIVTALFARQSGQTVNSYSVDFSGKDVVERDYAHLIAKRYATAHRDLDMTPSLALQELEALAPQMDEPIADSAIAPSYALSKMTRADGMKVILSGAGGDELFGGYFRHQKHKRDSFIGRFGYVPNKFWMTLGNAIDPRIAHYGAQLTDTGVAYALATSGMHVGLLSRLMNGGETLLKALSLTRSQFSKLPLLEKEFGFSYARMMTDVNQYLVDDVLSLFDKTSMAVSQEGRVPLLDHRLVELVFSVDPEINLTSSNPKQSLKEAVSGLLPDAICKRAKAGFNAPIRQWMREPEFTRIATRLKNTENPVIRKFLKKSALDNLLANPQHATQSAPIVFALFVFDLWHEGRFS